MKRKTSYNIVREATGSRLVFLKKNYLSISLSKIIFFKILSKAVAFQQTFEIGFITFIALKIKLGRNLK